MEDAFEKLKASGKTDVESLIKWMKESKIVEDTKAAEEKARALFNDAADKQKVELAKFKDAVAKLAEEQKKSVNDLMTKLAEHRKQPGLFSELAHQGEEFMSALAAGASAFKDKFTKN